MNRWVNRWMDKQTDRQKIGYSGYRQMQYRETKTDVEIDERRNYILRYTEKQRCRNLQSDRARMMK